VIRADRAPSRCKRHHTGAPISPVVDWRSHFPPPPGNLAQRC
jgi:hypothetical protein